MKAKIIVLILCLIFVGTGTGFAILHIATSTDAATPQVEPSVDIGVLFSPEEAQITYSPFAPTISRGEAIKIAKNWLYTGHHMSSDNLPVDSTVALYSGTVARTLTREPYAVSDMPVWIVVIKELPTSFSKPAGATFNFAAQADVVIDAANGDVLNARIIGKQIPAE